MGEVTPPSPIVVHSHQNHSGKVAGGWQMGAVSLAALFVLVAVNSALDLRRERADLFRLLDEQGQTLLRAVQQGTENALRAADEVESLLAERLLDVARDVVRKDASGDIDDAVLYDYAQRHQVHRIIVLDSDGEVVTSSHGHGRRPRAWRAREIAAPILAGDQEELVVGFLRGRYQQRKIFAVVLARQGGRGAIVANLAADTVLSFISRIGITPLLERMAESPGIVAAALFGPNGEPLLGYGDRPPIEGGLELGLVRAEGSSRYRVSSPVQLPQGAAGRVVLDLSLASVHELSREAYRHAAISLAVFALLLAAGTILWRLEVRHRESARAVVVEEERRTLVQQLAGSVAHEVRNPLNAIAMGLQRLSRRHRDAQDAELLGILEEEVRRLDTLVEDFLDLTRSAQIERTAVEPGPLAQRAVALLREEAEAQGVSITLDDGGSPALCLCDADKITQALVNIIRNAIQVSPVGAAVDVVVETHDTGVRFRVCDRGAGTTPEEREKLFQPFVSQRPGGTGLGLPVVREIAVAHGGTITLGERAGGGTCAALILPGNETRDG